MHSGTCLGTNSYVIFEAKLCFPFLCLFCKNVCYQHCVTSVLMVIFSPTNFYQALSLANILITTAVPNCISQT